MNNETKQRLIAILYALPIALLCLIVLAFACLSVCSLIYAFALSIAYSHIMPFLVMFGAFGLFAGFCIIGIEAEKHYIDFYFKTIKPSNPTDLSRKRNKYFTLQNTAFCFLLIGAICAVASAFLDSIERDTWVDIRSDYMLANNYYSDITKYESTHPIYDNNIEIFDKIDINLDKKNAVVIFSDEISTIVNMTGYQSYEKQLMVTIDGNTLHIDETPSPKNDGALENLLFFLFSENKVEQQVRVYIPNSQKDKIEISGNYVIAKN